MPEPSLRGLRRLPRNLWAASAGSFFMDISSEMIVHLLPLFLFQTLGVRTAVIGLVEGVAEATSSLVKVASGALSDRLRSRKWLAVSGYALSALAKPGFYLASTWTAVAGTRWVDRVGKGIRTAPRDALVADSLAPGDRGLGFGLHRAADTAGAVLGLGIALAVVHWTASEPTTLSLGSFRLVVLVSLVPALLSVVSLAALARDVPPSSSPSQARASWRDLGRPFHLFLAIAGLFDLGNFSDAFLVLRARERGLTVPEVLATLLAFNLVYALVSAPAGRWSDRFGRKSVLITGWLIYGILYLGFAWARSGRDMVALFLAYGAYYGLATGTAKALVADLVAPPLRGTAFGAYNALLGVMNLPASLLAGLLWQGLGSWQGFGPTAPFLFGAACALAAAVLLAAAPLDRAPHADLESPPSSRP